jgi:hypothetical protein
MSNPVIAIFATNVQHQRLWFCSLAQLFIMISWLTDWFGRLPTIASDQRNKKGAPNQGSSRNPDQGAQKNSTWPTLPCGSAVQALLLLQEPEGSGWSFSWKQ